MSYNYDENIVSMKFDNSDFEKNVRVSMNTIDELKSNLDFKDCEKSFEGLTKSANAVNFNNLSDSTSVVVQKVNAMASVIDKTIDKVVADVYNNAKKVMNGLTVEPITDGFSKYEREMVSVQTIMNATGRSIDEVQRYIDKLAWYADETSYSYNDMINNVGQFVNKGLELDDAVQAMIGIGNAAGFMGATTADATHAMEGFSKAMGQQYMSQQTWSWLRTAHMDGMQFKQVLIDAAVAAGTLQKSEEGVYTTMKGEVVTARNFETTLKERWLNQKAMNIALMQFGEFSEEVYKKVESGEMTTAEAMEYLSGSFSELSEQGMVAAQVSRTFSDAVNYTKDAVSSGWKTTWKYVFGNLEEAKEIWTEFTDFLYETVVVSGEKRNELLEEWNLMGGREELLDAVRAFGTAIGGLLGTIKGSFDSMFGGLTGEALANLTAKVRAFAEAMIFSDDALEGLGNIVKVLLTPLKAVGTAIKYIAIGAVYLSVTIHELLDSFLSLFSGTNKMEGFLGKIFNTDQVKAIQSALTPLLQNLGKAFEAIRTKVSNFVNTVLMTSLPMEKLSTVFGKVRDAFGSVVVYILNYLSKIDFTKYVNNASSAFDKLTGVFSKAYEKIKEILDKFHIFEAVKDIFNSIEFTPDNLLKGLGDAILWVKNEIAKFFSLFTDTKEAALPFTNTINAVTDSLNVLSDKANAAEKKVGVIEKVFGGVSDAFSNLSMTSYAAESAMTNWVYVTDEMAKAGDTITESKMATSIGEIKKALADLYVEFQPIIDKIIAFSQKALQPSQLVVYAYAFAIVTCVKKIGKAFTSFASTFQSIGERIDSFLGSFSGLISGFKEIPTHINSAIDELGKTFASFRKETKADAIVKIAIAIGLLTAAIIGLAYVPIDKVKEVLPVFGIIAGAALGAMVAITALEKIFKGFNVGKGAIAMLSASVAILAVTFALKKVSEIDITNIGEKLGALMVTMIGFIGLSTLMGQMDLGGALKSAAVMFLLSVSSKRVVEAFNLISEQLIEKSTKTTLKLVVFMGAVSVLASAIGRIKFGTGVGIGVGIAAGLLGIATSFAIIVGTLKLLESVSLTTIFKGIGLISAIMVLFGLLSMMMITLKSMMGTVVMGNKVVESFEKTMRSFAISLVIISASLVIAAKAVQMMGSLNFFQWLGGLAGLAIVCELLVFVANKAKVAAKSAGTILALSVALIAMSTVMYLVLGVGMVATLLLNLGCLKGLLAAGGIFAALVYAMNSLIKAAEYNKRAKPTTIMALSASLIAMSVAMYAILGVAAIASLIPLRGLIAAGSAILLLGTVMSTMLLVSHFANGDWKSILAVVASVVVVATSLAALSAIPWPALLVASLSMAAVLGTFAAVLVGMHKLNSKQFIQLFLLLGELAGAVWIFKQLETIDAVKLLASGAAIAGALLALSVALGKASGLTSLKSSAGILALSVAVIAIAGALKFLGSIPFGTIVGGGIAISGVLLAMGFAGSLIAPVAPVIAEVAISLLAFGGACLAIAGSLALAAFGFQMFAEGVATLIPALAQLTSGMIERLAGLGSAIASFIGETFFKIITVIGQYAGPIVSVVINFILNLISQARVLIPQFLTLVKETLLGIVATLREAIPNVVSAGIDIIMSLLRELNEHMEEFAYTAVMIVVNFLAGIEASLPALVDEAFLLIVTFIESLATAVDEHGEDLVNAAFHLIEAVITSIGGAIVANAGRFIALGGQCLNGFLDGLSDTESLYSAGEVLGDALYEGAADSLDVHSPSRRFYGLGLNTVLGAYNGIDDSSELLEAAGELIGTTVFDSASGEMLKIDNLGRAVDVLVAEGVVSDIDIVETAGQALPYAVMAGAASTEATDGVKTVGGEVDKLYAGGIMGNTAIAQAGAEAMVGDAANSANIYGVAAFTTVGQNCVAAFNEQTAGLAGLEGLKSSIAAKTKGIINAVSHPVDTIKDMFSDVSKDINESLTNALDAGGGKGKGGGGGKGSSTKKSTDIMDYASSVVERYRHSYEELYETLGRTDIIDHSKSVMMDFAKAVYEADGKMVKETDESIAEMLENFQKFVEGMSGSIQKQLTSTEGFTEAFNMSSKNMMKNMATNKKAVDDFIMYFNRAADNGISESALIKIAQAGFSAESLNQLRVFSAMTIDEVKAYNKRMENSNAVATSLTDKLISDMAFRHAQKTGEIDASNTAWANSTSETTQKIQSKLSELALTYDETFQSVKSSLDSTVKHFEEFKLENEDAISLSDMIENEKSQKEAMEKWVENIREINHMDVSKELKQYMIEMGRDGGYWYAEALVSGSEEEIKELDSLFKEMSNLDSYADDIATSFAVGTTQGLDEMVKSLKDSANSEALSAELSNLGFRMGQSFWDGSVEGLTNIVGYAENLRNGVDQMLSDSLVTELFGKYGVASTKKLSSGILDPEALTGLKTDISELYDVIQECFEGSFDLNGKSTKSVYDLGKLMTEALSNGIEENDDEPERTTLAMAEKVFDTASTTLDEANFFRLGSYIVQGLAAGIRENKRIAIDAMAELTEELEGEYRDETETESPSKVYTRLGGYIVEGLANGIKHNTSLAVDSMGNLSNETIDAFNAVVESLNAYVDDNLEMQPVIAPIVDMTNAEVGLAAIDNVMGKNFKMGVTASNATVLANSFGSRDQEAQQKNDGNVFNFTQNNYSPKSLSRLDIYRQTHNQFARMKELVGT